MVMEDHVEGGFVPRRVVERDFLKFKSRRLLDLLASAFIHNRNNRFGSVQY